MNTKNLNELAAAISEYPQISFFTDANYLRDFSSFADRYATQINLANKEMQELEAGAIANQDENRMVGHYWLRSPQLAPDPQLSKIIESTKASIKDFANAVIAGKITNASGQKFKTVVVAGIGGSALGPQMVERVFKSPAQALNFHFMDNTDPAGIDDLLARIPELATTLCVIISKSGGTRETRNAQLLLKSAFQKQGLKFASNFVAVTQEGSELDKMAVAEEWSQRFPMWDWVGGRTSLWSAVGLLPAALQGIDIDRFLSGAAAMDEVTRSKDLASNPALLLATTWYHLGKGRGEKAMVVLPYRDRLELSSKYLQQLVMESLGKELDRSGERVNQGLTVLGNKGSTDQHSYVQQLRDGLANFFAVFIEVLEDQDGPSQGNLAATSIIEEQASAGDYLNAFMQGTRSALFANGRESITLTLRTLDEFSLGGLLALFERAVGLYASMINVNAYHQPGVEAGKKAAQKVIGIQENILNYLKGKAAAVTLEQIAADLELGSDTSTVYYVARHLAANKRAELNTSKGLATATLRLL